MKFILKTSQPKDKKECSYVVKGSKVQSNCLTYMNIKAKYKHSTDFIVFFNQLLHSLEQALTFQQFASTELNNNNNIELKEPGPPNDAKFDLSLKQETVQIELIWFQSMPMAHIILDKEVLFTQVQQQIIEYLKNDFPHAHIDYSEAIPKKNDLPEDVTDTRDVTIDGLFLFPRFLNSDDSIKLIQEIDQRQWDDHLIGRRTQHYGYAFDYTTKHINPDHPIPIDSFLVPLLKKTSDAARDALQDPTLPDFDQITINEYKKGDGIATHVDTHSAFGPVIISLSLLSGTTMKFSHPVNPAIHKNVYLEPDSLLIMSRAARYLYSHQIPYRKTDCVANQIIQRQRRISLTFRTVLSKGVCACQWPNQCDSQNGKITIPRIASLNEK